jgi:hypothetical protein
MNRLREFFTPKKDFSYTILNPVDVCIQRIESEPTGCNRFLYRIPYDISRVDNGHYHIVSNDGFSSLEANMIYKDEGITIVHGWTKPGLGIVKGMFIMGMLGFWGSLSIMPVTNIFYRFLCSLLVVAFLILAVLQLGKKEREYLMRKFLDTISSSEPEKKKKHV